MVSIFVFLKFILSTVSDSAPEFPFMFHTMEKELENAYCICIDFDAIFVIFPPSDDLIPKTSVAHEDTGGVDLSSDGNTPTDVESSVTGESCNDSSSSSSSEGTRQKRKEKKSKNKKNKSKKHKKNMRKDKNEYDRIKRGKHSSHKVFIEIVVLLTGI